MPERWITPPADVPLFDPNTDKPAQEPDPEHEGQMRPVMAKWSEIMTRLLQHPKLCGTTPALKSNNLLRRGFKAAQVGVPYSVPEEDWARLNAVLNDPDDVGGRERAQNALSSLVRYVSAVLPQLEDFFTAWTEAPAKRPEPKSVPAEPPAA